MVEVLEYLLVFAITAAVAGFSIFVFSGSLPVVTGTQGQAEVAQVAGAVELAASNGSSTLVLPLTNASLMCAQGALQLTTGGESYAADVSAGCSFDVSGLSCLCSLQFTGGSDGVTLEVNK